MFFNIISTKYQKIGDLFCPVIFLDFRTVRVQFLLSMLSKCSIQWDWKMILLFQALFTMVFNRSAYRRGFFYGCCCCSQSHYREVPRWEIFMEQELRFGLDLSRLAVLKKKVGADYEQLMRVVFSNFCGQKKIKIWKHCSVRTEKLHKKKVKKKLFLWEIFFSMFLSFLYRLKFEWNLSVNT